jgi:hypothetical protein
MVDREELRKFIEDGMNEELNVIKEPKGILDGAQAYERKRISIFAVEEEHILEQISASMSFDDNLTPKLVIKENRMQIGFGEYSKQHDGSIDLRITLVGAYAVETDNISGFARMKGVIPASLRKD